MINKIKNYKITTILAFVLSIFNMFFYYSMRCIWTGIGKVLAGNQMIPNLLMIIIFIVFVCTFVLSALKIEKLPMYIMLGLSGVFLIGNAAIVFLGAWDYLIFIGREFVQCLLFLCLALILIWFVFFYKDSSLSKNKYFKYSFTCAIIIGFVISSLGLGVNTFTYKPVVYAVENEYQIVFTTSMDSTAWISVGDQEYFDLYAGSEKSETKVHKVCVPMSELDNEKEYTVYIKSMLMRGPYGSFEGKTKSLTYNFKPVDTTDGFNYYTISDVHGATESAIKAASIDGDNLDCLFMLGDIYSILDNVSDVQSINEIAYGVTKGEKPVVYARGNHEVKGDASHELYKYVGSVNEDFYFEVYLGDVYIIVLDMGEDHDDDWWEYYDTAHFDLYRDEQKVMVEEAYNNKHYENSKYKIALSHFPMVHIHKGGFLKSYKEYFTEMFNLMDFDIHYAGHEHRLIPFIPDDYESNKLVSFNNSKFTSSKGDYGYITDADFYSFIVSCRTDVQNDDVKQNQLGNKLVGVATNVDFTTNKITINYTNQDQELVYIVNPFNSIEYGTTISLDLK